MVKHYVRFYGFFGGFFLVVVKKAKKFFDMVLRVFLNLSFCFGVIVCRV